MIRNTQELNLEVFKRTHHSVMNAIQRGDSDDAYLWTRVLVLAARLHVQTHDELRHDYIEPWTHEHQRIYDRSLRLSDLKE